MIKHADHMRPNTFPLFRVDTNEEYMSSDMIVRAPQALADRRSTHIADLVVIQRHCLQGGIVPVRVHTLHTVE